MNPRFKIRVDEWDYLDGSHANETLNYLIIEAGQHMLDDGTIIEAGTIEVDSDGAWVSFDENFEAAPVILTQVMTNNEASAVTVRTSGLTCAGFNLTLQKEEAADGIHSTETVGYIAIVQGSGETFDGNDNAGTSIAFEAGISSVNSSFGSITYGSGPFNSTPLLFASMQSTAEVDTAALRYQNASSTGVQLMIQEETSYDGETTHATESVGFLAIESGNIWVDTNGDNYRDTIFEAEIEACKAVNQKLIEQGFGDVADVVVVGFDGSARYLDLDPQASGMQFHTTPNADTNGINGCDVEEELTQMAAGGGGTDFESALNYTIEALENDDNAYVDPADPNYDPVDDGLGPAVKNGSNGNVLFLSDGGHNAETTFTDEVLALKGTEFEEGWADNVRAFGVGQNADIEGSLSQIDSNAERFMTPYGLMQAMVNAIDTDGDGERDYVESDLGMSGVTVYIDANDNGVFDDGVETSTVTDADGLYSFTSLGAGTYIVRQVAPEGFAQTYPVGGAAQVVVLGADEDVYNVNFGNNYATAVAVDDSAITDEDVPVTIDVLANDTVPGGKTRYFSRVNQPEHGTAEWNGSNIVYTPDLDWNGTDTFSYAVTLGGGEYFKATVTVTVNPMPDGPRVEKLEMGNAIDNMYEIATGTDNTQLIPVDIDGGVNRVKITFDRAIDNDNLDVLRNLLAVYGRRSGGWGGASDVSINVEQTGITWVFSDDAHKGGEMILKLSDEITSDGEKLDGEWTSPNNFEDNGGNSTFAGEQTSGDGTPGGDFVFSFTLPNTRPGDANRDGVVDGDDSDIQTANWLQTGKSWTEGDFNGDEFVDDVDATMMAANWLTTVWSSGAITPSDPVACDLVFTMDVDGTLDGQLLGYPQGRMADVTYQLVGGPSQGSLAGGGVNADGTFTYTPPALYSGVATFTYTVSDGVNSSNVATVTVYVGVAPPRVTCVTLKNSSTSQQQDIPTDDDGYDQILPVPLYDGFDQVIITFDQPVSAVAGDMTLNKAGTTYYATGISTSGNTCTWTFDGPDANDMFKYGPLVIELSDDVTAYGLDLDGEWTSPGYYGDDVANSTFVGGQKSGDGYEGGEFVFNFSMLLPGDANCDGIVDETDSGIISAHWLQGPGMTWAEGDFSGNGYVNDTDATIMATNWYKTYWETAAIDGEFDVAASGTLNDNLTGKDRMQGDDVTFERIGSAAHGSATVNSDGSFTYTPTPGYSGLDTFTFRTYDGVDYSEPATTTVYVGAPTVKNIVVQNSTTEQWAYIETAADGDDQLMPVPIYEGIDKIWVLFNGDATVTLSDLKLNGEYADSFYMWDTPYGRSCEWTFSTDGPFQFGPMTIELSDAVNINGVALDGEWTSPAYYGDNTGNSTFDGGLTSGDGQHGGDFVFNFSMLFPGDANCDGIVSSTDFSILCTYYNSGPGLTWANGDFNFDGYVNDIDLSILSTNYGQTVWPEPQMLCMGGGILGGEMLLAADTRSSSLESSLSASSALDDLFEKYDFGASAAAVTAADDFIDEFVTLFEKYEDELALFEDDYVSPHKVSNDLFDSIFAQQELLEV